MNDETITPFVDALSASLIIMILVAISFILQNAIAIDISARQFADIKLGDAKYSPVIFNRPVQLDMENKELLFLVNFQLTATDINDIRSTIIQQKELNLSIYSKQPDRQSTANLVRFITMLNLPQDIVITTNIEESESTLSRLTWSK